MTVKPKRRQEIITLLVVFLAVLVVSALIVYSLSGWRRPGSADSKPVVQSQPGEANRPGIDPSPGRSTGSSQNESFIDSLLGTRNNGETLSTEGWVLNIGHMTLRLFLAALLGAGLAFRPRKRILAMKRNPYVAQTQILLAIVAAALMIIVGDNAARAFGIFAAVSLVRFRTNIKDPKEITVLLISLALGLASGVGRWDLALILAIFSLIVLSLLEWREPSQVFRSMEVKVTTKNVVATQKALREVFKKFGFDRELRAVDRELSEESPGNLMYSVDISPTVTTDEISEEILHLDGVNIQGIEWNQKKSFSYLYQ